ncbi:uncharacterized protein LOC110269175 [Arachis ipaensis]|uniref:uncharacterized protein LOC110269175 n=1 Tax=Arachis ipaensis TaxID=130454 RepID=UPI000A2B5B6C|nr:uncharacterized protein LOC110269175 [Arachis ipaensis]
MAPFETLYGRRCRSPIGWFEVGEVKLLGPNLVQDAVENVFLRVSPMKGVIRFEKRDNFSPRYVGPFEILDRIGAVTYCLVLPSELFMIHPVFHVSMLRKYLPNPSHVLALQSIELKEDLSFEEERVAIVDCQVKKLCYKEIAS